MRSAGAALLAGALLFALPAFSATPPGTVIRNQAQVGYSVLGYPSTSGSNTDEITVAAPPVATLSLSRAPTPAHPGDTLLIDITIANPGAQDLAPGQIVMSGPAGAIFQGGATISVPAIPSGGSTTLQVQLVLALSTPLGTAEIRGDYEAPGVVLTAALGVEVVARTASSLDALRYAPSSTSGSVLVPLTQYETGSGLAPCPPPALPDGIGHVRDRPIPLAPASSLRVGQILFAQLADPDQNRDPAAVEWITLRAEVRLADGTQLDTQIYVLEETAPASGLFLGYLETTGGSAAALDGLLSVERGSRIDLIYGDPLDSGDSAALVVLVDPFGRVFDSASGRPIDGVSVTLIDAATNAPATVVGDDGVSAYPSTLVTGSTVTDGGGTVYDLPQGGFRFPLVAPGSYRFQVALPAGAGFTWPSTASDSELQSLPDAPFAIDVGSRGEAFAVVDGPPLNIDLPIDPGGLPLSVRKASSRTVASVGEFVQYRIEVESTRAIDPVGSVTLTDVLPPGFRFKPGSARIDGGEARDPVVSGDGRTLQFDLGVLAPGATTAVSYVAELGAVRPGAAVNTAAATGSLGAVSNTARAVVLVREDLFRSRTILLGRVAAADQGIAGVRIYLEDGTYVVTDERGMFHFEGLVPGVHVVQLDLETLPDGYEVEGDREWSKFVDVQGGATWRVDFELAPTHRPSVASGLDTGAGESARTPGVETTPAQDAAAMQPDVLRQEETAPRNIENESRLRYDAAWIERAEPGRRWLVPAEDYRPRVPSVDVGIQHAPDERVELYLNGTAVPKENFEKTLRNKAGSVAFSQWLGLDLVPGDNRLEARVTDREGVEIDRLHRVVHYPGPPVGATLDASRSTLTADGVTPPVLAVRFLDRDGHPAREGSIGQYRVQPPYRPKRLSPFELAVMPGAPPETTRYTIGPDGIARIELEPTTDAGQVKIVIPLENGEHELFATLSPKLRDWVVVALAEGTAGTNAIRGNMEPLDANAAADDLYTDGRVAFYAKGRVRGEWLLTLAYDSEKNTSPSEGLYGTIDPGTYYTVYGDRGGQLYDAASREKLYVKLERSQFFALFGDFDTGLTRSELVRYSRSLTGLKSRYGDERYELIAFASDAEQAFVKDEIRGEGISGPYRLSRRDIVLNSEKVSIQVRDRFRSEVIRAERVLTRHFDYDVDYVEGTLVFREAIFAIDQRLDHVYIVVDYETLDPGDHALTFGGRVEAKVAGDRLQVGLSHVTEGCSGDCDDAAMNGIDAVVHLTPGLRARVELACTSEDARDAGAYLAEVEHQAASGTGKIYYREVEEGFGLGQIGRSESGTRKQGIEANYRLGQRFTVRGQAFRQESLLVDTTQDVVEAETVVPFPKGSVHAGLRLARDELPGAETRSSDLLKIGATRKFLDDRLDLLAEREQPIGGDAEAVNYPARTRLGVEYRLDRETSIFLGQEWADGAERDSRDTVVGLKSTPWSGAEISTNLRRSRAEESETDAASFAIRQKWTLGPRWSLDTGLERSRVLSGEDVPPLNANVPFASGSTGNATASSLGVTYHPGPWLWTARLDWRDASAEDRRGLASSIQTNPRADLSVLFGLSAFDRDSAAGEGSTRSNVRLGLAYRPPSSRWTLLDRLEGIQDHQSGVALSFRNARVVNNLNANHRSGRWQTSLQYGAKFSRDTIDGVTYEGYTDLVGVESRFDLTPLWDVGLRASLLHAWGAEQLDYHYGASVGRDIGKNVWLSVGYNVAGFEDRDFAGAEGRSRGPFLSFRMKLDQQSVQDALRWWSHE